MTRLERRLQPWGAARRLLARLRAFAGARSGLAVALVAAGALLEGTGLILLAPILTVVTSDAGTGPGSGVVAWLRQWGLAGAAAQLQLLLGAFLLVMLARAAILFTRDMTLARLQTGFVEAQRNRVIHALAAAPWVAVAGLRHARVSNLMSAEMQRLGASVQYLIQGGVALAMLAIQAGIALFLAPSLAATMLLLFAGAGVLLVFGQRRARDLGIEVVQTSQMLMGSAAGFLGGLKTAAAQNAQAPFVEEFETIQATLRSRQLQFLRRQARARLGFGLASALAGAALVWAGYALFAVAPAVLITLVVVFVRMSGPALLVQQAAQNFFFGVGSFEAIEELVADLSRVDAPAACIASELPRGAIVLRSAGFAHPGGRGVRGVDLTIAPGSFIGITGASGSGKTTLIDLLAGLISPQTGEIRIGDVPLGEGNAATWQRRIGYVAQDGFLFHDSVRRNLLWGAEAPDDEAVAAALALTGADALVARLHEGLDTVVGERGALLSGGEHQRLNLTRGLLRAPDLLILDEATNALDRESEAAILTRLAALERRPMIVMITHRAESLRHCDRVLQVVDGEVREISVGAISG